MVCVWCSLKATSSLTFCSEVDSEGKEKQASEREIDCGSTGALAFKDVGDFRPRSPHTLTICASSCFLILLPCSLFVFKV